jgi:site-specific DNA recombinase
MLGRITLANSAKKAMKRAAIYARFSTDNQSERSVEDQITLCRKFCVQNDLHVVAEYSDKAMSGASLIGRDGVQDVLSDARTGKFDVIVIEALDRLSRDMEDLSAIYKRMTHLDIEIRAVHDGTANTVLVGLRGLVAQMFREDTVLKVRRGLSGRVKSGLCRWAGLWLPRHPRPSRQARDPPRGS